MTWIEHVELLYDALLCTPSPKYYIEDIEKNGAEILAVAEAAIGEVWESWEDQE
jgi:hypothetical protein